MPFQPAVNCAEVVVNATLNGQSCVNTFYARKADGYDQTELEALATAVDNWVDTTFKLVMPTSWIYTGTTARGLTSSIDLIAENNDGAGAGENGPSTAPNNKALAVKRRTANTGRGARGRVYLAPPADLNMEDNNTVDETFVTSVETVLNGFRSAIATVDWTEVILHRVAAGVPLEAALALTVIEYVVVDRTIDSMRRRLPRRGS